MLEEIKYKIRLPLHKIRILRITTELGGGVPTYPQHAQDLHHLLCEQRVEAQCRGGGTESQLATQVRRALGRETSRIRWALSPMEGNFPSGHGSHLPQPATSGGTRTWQEKMNIKYNYSISSQSSFCLFPHCDF